MSEPRRANQRYSRVRWIAFEGGEGCGKSTQARLLAPRIEGAVLTREPGGTPIGERIRAILLDTGTADLDARAELLLMAADRAQHISAVVAPALDAGRPIVSDRSAFSSLAYQGFGRGLPIAEVRSVCDWASSGRWPDLVVLLEVDDDERRSRMSGAPDRLEAAGDGFHQRVAEGFRTLAAADPLRWVVIEGGGDVDQVAARVWAAVESRA